MEYREAERLSLRVRSKIGLESERVNGWHESLDGIHGGASNGGILGHVTSGTKIISFAFCLNQTIHMVYITILAN